MQIMREWFYIVSLFVRTSDSGKCVYSVSRVILQRCWASSSSGTGLQGVPHTNERCIFTNEKCVTQVLVHMFPVILCSLLYTKSVSHPSLSDVPWSLWKRVHMPVMLRKLLYVLRHSANNASHLS